MIREGTPSSRHIHRFQAFLVAVRIRAAVVSVGAAVQRRVLGRVWLLGEEFVFAGMGFVVMVPLPGTATLD